VLKFLTSEKIGFVQSSLPAVSFRSSLELERKIIGGICPTAVVGCCRGKTTNKRPARRLTSLAKNTLAGHPLTRKVIDEPYVVATLTSGEVTDP
jgi:hypothetical protein